MSDLWACLYCVIFNPGTREQCECCGRRRKSDELKDWDGEDMSHFDLPTVERGGKDADK